MMTSNTPNTRPSSPRSNADTPRGGNDYDDLVLSQLHSLPNTPINSPRPNTYH
jgi:hypothetical protein